MIRWLALVAPSDGVQLAIIASFTTLASQILTHIMRWRDKHEVRQGQAKLANQIAATAHELNSKIDANTSITLDGNATASSAYREANNFNVKLDRITNIESELARQGRNIHKMANLLTAVINKPLDLEKGK